MTTPASPRQKVAILGGGVGSMIAAFEITSQPDWQSRYDITVYQLGWRVGGKGASGRNQAFADRIQEHGLHVWMGFYENAFDCMRQAYEYCAQHNLTPGTPFPTYIDAFRKMSFAPVAEEHDDGTWGVWPLFWPPNDDTPGKPNEDTDDPAPLPPHPTPWDYIKFILAGLEASFHRLFDGEPFLEGLIMDIVDAIMKRAELGPASGVPRDTPFHRLSFFAHSLPDDHSQHDPAQHRLLLTFFKGVLDLLDHSKFLWHRFAGFRHFVIVAETAYGFIHGIIRDGILDRGFSAIDDQDFIEWLASTGCRYAESPLTVAMCDGAFAYENGDPNRRRAAAGSVLHGALRIMFTSRGAFMWFMNAGMGDTVFTPLYLALKHRGVRFEFFRKVTRLTAGPDQTVSSIEMDIQAHVKPELGDYNPLYPVKGLLCWPSQPFYNQLVEGDILQDPKFVNRDLESYWSDLPKFGKQTLKHGEDFDKVILGISIGALPILCEELIAADSTGAWRNMIDKVKVVRTQAFQLWLNQSKEAMGWDGAGTGRTDPPVFCGYVEPFDTWGDETQLTVRESWPEGLVQSNPYFCNAAPDDPQQAPFSDPTYPARQLAIVKQNTVNFLNDSIQLLFPKAVNDKGFNWDLLVNQQSVTPPIDSQFVRVNIDPSELYVLSIPGSTKFRLAPWDTKYKNLIFAGDWTLNDVNLGCVEGAVQSGKLASFALTGTPDFLYGAFRHELPIKKIFNV